MGLFVACNIFSRGILPEYIFICPDPQNLLFVEIIIFLKLQNQCHVLYIIENIEKNQVKVTYNFIITGYLLLRLCPMIYNWSSGLCICINNMFRAIWDHCVCTVSNLLGSYLRKHLFPH